MSWMEVEEPTGEKDKSDEIINILKIAEWNFESKEAIISSLSRKESNRSHFQILSAIQKCTSDVLLSSKIFDNLVKANLLELLVQFILEDSVNTAEMSASIMVNLSTFAIGLLEILLPLLIQKFENLSKEEEENYGTLRLRILYLFAKISITSDAAFDRSRFHGSLGYILAAFDLDDVLEVLNVIEVLQIVGSKVIGLAYLIEMGIAQQLVDLVSKEDDDAGGILRDKSLSWILASTRNSETQSLLLKSVEVLDALQLYFENGNPLDGIIVIGSIGRTESGLAKLFENERPLLDVMLSHIHQGVESKICVLSSLTEMFEKRTTMGLEEVNQLELLFNCLGKEIDNDVIVYLLDLLKTPYLDLRIASYAFISGLIKYEWGIQKISSTPGFLDFLLTRDREIELEGNAWKFVIFQKLVEHPKCKEIIGSYQYLNCIEYLKRGVYWKKTETRVEVEDMHM
jgi:26S proteasome non-ATPase regulatory subunit 5